MKFEVKYVVINISNASDLLSGERFFETFEKFLKKYASNTKAVFAGKFIDNKSYGIRVTLQKHIALSTFCNILNSIQNNSRVICSSINYEYNTCRAVVNVKIC